MTQKQTAIQWYCNKLTEILGDKCNELTAEQTLANHYAIKEAENMFKQQIIKAYRVGKVNGVDRIWEENVTGEQYYSETYGGNNGHI